MAQARPNKELAVITGASSGIGFELARVFAKNGFDLLICAEDIAIIEAHDHLKATGVDVQSMQVDLAKPEGVVSFYEKIKSLGRPVDALALNAGIGMSGDFVRDADLDHMLKLIDLNVRSVVHLAKLVLQDMVAQNRGRILFTSSIAAMMPGSYEPVYNASKSFIQSFAQAIRTELKDTNITITALQPGATETDFFHRAGLDDTRIGQMKKDDAADVAQEGFDALMAGKDHVISGSFINKVMAAAGKILPEKVSSAAHTYLSEPGKGEPKH